MPARALQKIACSLAHAQMQWAESASASPTDQVVSPSRRTAAGASASGRAPARSDVLRAAHASRTLVRLDLRSRTPPGCGRGRRGAAAADEAARDDARAVEREAKAADGDGDDGDGRSPAAAAGRRRLPPAAAAEAAAAEAAAAEAAAAEAAAAEAAAAEAAAAHVYSRWS